MTVFPGKHIRECRWIKPRIPKDITKPLVRKYISNGELLALQNHLLFRDGSSPPRFELRFVKAAEAPLFSYYVSGLHAFSRAVLAMLSLKRGTALKAIGHQSL